MAGGNDLALLHAQRDLNPRHAIVGSFASARAATVMLSCAQPLQSSPSLLLQIGHRLRRSKRL